MKSIFKLLSYIVGYKDGFGHIVEERRGSPFQRHTKNRHHRRSRNWRKRRAVRMAMQKRSRRINRRAQ